MTDGEIITFATEFREGVLDGASSKWMCAAVSWPLCTLLGINGVKGTCVESDLGEMNHIWILLDDGRVLDPTADQFNDLFPRQYPPVYLGKRTELHT